MAYGATAADAGLNRLGVTRKNDSRVMHPNAAVGAVVLRDEI